MSGKISIIVPVYKSQETINELVERLVKTLSQLENDYEIILVDDRSPDDSWQILKKLKSIYKNQLSIIRLQSNSGQHNALIAGLSRAKGDFVITIDDDLQNPPEEIPRIIEMLNKGCDLVIGSYAVKEHNYVRNFSGKLIDKILRMIFKLPKNFQLTSYRGIKRSVVDRVLEMKSSFPYLTAMLLSNTSNYSNIDVQHHRRKYGKSNYTIVSGLRLAANLLFNYTTLPVIFVGVIALFAFFFSVFVGGWVAMSTLAYGSNVPGWASTIAILSFLNSIILLCMFIFSMYLSRINRLLMRGKINYIISDIDEV